MNTSKPKNEVALTVSEVLSFFDSWGLDCTDDSMIPYGLLPSLLEDAKDLGGTMFSTFVTVITDTTDDETYLNCFSEDELIESWCSYVKEQSAA